MQTTYTAFVHKEKLGRKTSTKQRGRFTCICRVVAFFSDETNKPMKRPNISLFVIKIIYKQSAKSPRGGS